MPKRAAKFVKLARSEIRYIEFNRMTLYKEEAESQSNGMSYNFNKEVKSGVLRLCSGRQKQRKF